MKKLNLNGIFPYPTITNEIVKLKNIICVECGKNLGEGDLKYKQDNKWYCKTCYYTNHRVCCECKKIFNIINQFDFCEPCFEKFILM